MNDFPVLNRDDRNKPVVVGRTARENLPVHFVFKDHPDYPENDAQQARRQSEA